MLCLNDQTPITLSLRTAAHAKQCSQGASGSSGGGGGGGGAHASTIDANSSVMQDQTDMSTCINGRLKARKGDNMFFFTS